MYKSYEAELIELAIDNGLSRAILGFRAFLKGRDHQRIMKQMQSRFNENVIKM